MAPHSHCRPSPPRSGTSRPLLPLLSPKVISRQGGSSSSSLSSRFPTSSPSMIGRRCFSRGTSHTLTRAAVKSLSLGRRSRRGCTRCGPLSIAIPVNGALEPSFPTVELGTGRTPVYTLPKKSIDWSTSGPPSILLVHSGRFWYRPARGATSPLETTSRGRISMHTPLRSSSDRGGMRSLWAFHTSHQRPQHTAAGGHSRRYNIPSEKMTERAISMAKLNSILSFWMH
mmetsp:Transcript_33180/g.61116  ORF Transcript_33180/g.61116 Transcript_33180/m.61116 type:complete len:228 (-) Transcript_33180:115-798(-)